MENKEQQELMKKESKKASPSLWGKAKEAIVKAADQNDDGAFDFKDVSVIAGTIGNAAKSTATAMLNSADEQRREMERKLLQPIFAEDLDNADFFISKLVRVTEIDKRRAESDVCKGSIGYITNQKDVRIVNIFKDKLDYFGLQFYPDADCELYYVDPSDRDKYIALGDYFDYLKVARVNELQKIAQDLGAKHFRVTYKEEKTSFSSKNVKVKVSAKTADKSEGPSANEGAEYNHDATEMSKIEIAAEMDCPGHEPHEPKLYYLQRELSVQNLIALRMDESSPLEHHIFAIRLSNSTGIKENDAIKIDAALKAMKISGNTTVTSEVRNESRRLFEYEVDF